MAAFLFKPNFHHCFEADPHEHPEIVLSIVFISRLCVGLPVLIWTVCDLYHRKNGNKVSVFVTFLLLSDALEMVLSPYILTKLLSGEKCYYTSVTCKILISMWSGARSCGLHFPQLVALESILSLTHPDCSAHIFSRPLSIILSIIVVPFVMISAFLDIFPAIVTTFVIPAHLSIFVILCKFICTAPPSPHVAPKVERKRGSKILAVAMVTYVVLYLPSFVVMYMCILSSPYSRPYHHSALIITLSLVSFRVITNPLLCVLVSRENVRRQKPQTHTELITDLRSV